MCESTVLLKDDSGLSSVMIEAAKIVASENGCVCYDLMGRTVQLDDVRVAEIDLMRHRIILERA